MADLTDLEITRLCARAMGVRAYREKRGSSNLCVTVYPNDEYQEPWKRTRDASAKDRYTSVTLAEAQRIGFYGRGLPNPLHDDAQCMALVKAKFLHINWRPTPTSQEWTVQSVAPDYIAYGPDLNRAICLCVARMQQAKEK